MTNLARPWTRYWTAASAFRARAALEAASAVGGITFVLIAITAAYAQDAHPDAKTTQPFSELKVNPSSLKFNDINLFKGVTSEPESFTVTDSGTAPLIVTVGNPNDSVFTVTQGAGQTMLQPNGELTVTVKFEPSTVGKFAGTIAVAGKATKGKTEVSIKLTGLVTPSITADSSQPGPVMTSQQIGTNLQQDYADATNSQFVSAFQDIGIGLIRWPEGGAGSDWYHWATNVASSCSPYPAYPGNDFDDFMAKNIEAGGFQAAITVNYGSNIDCTGGGDPSEAAGWVNYANNVKHYGIKYWTVGNELFDPFGADYNVPSHDPTTYANRVANLFYPEMKAADPTIQVGVDVLGVNYSGFGNTWDPIVLSTAKYDFVEVHIYPEYGTNDDDTFLLTQGPDQIANTFAYIRGELHTAGHDDVPIYLGEFDDSAEFPFGKTQVSIVDGLFIGMAIGEVATAGVPLSTVWDGIEGCGTGGNFSPTLYGWQKFGSSGVFAASEFCAPFGVAPLTPFPKARAITVASQFITAGQHVLSVETLNPTSQLRAYAATQGKGYAFMLFNLNKNGASRQMLGVQNSTLSSFQASTLTYGKAQYDESKKGKWAGPVSRDLGRVSNPFNISLPPWSMTVVKLQP
jgi:hypothetical protein